MCVNGEPYQQVNLHNYRPNVVLVIDSTFIILLDLSRTIGL